MAAKKSGSLASGNPIVAELDLICFYVKFSLPVKFMKAN